MNCMLAGKVRNLHNIMTKIEIPFNINYKFSSCVNRVTSKKLMAGIKSIVYISS